MRRGWMVVAMLVAGPAAAAERPAGSARPAADADDKPVCRTTAPTGSLIANRRECHTRREWLAMRVDTSRPLQGGSCNSGESGHCY